MQCPVCGESLREKTRSGVTIDICPGCKGVWLDRGELDKLLTMECEETPKTAEQPALSVSSYPLRDEYRPEEHRHEHGHGHHHEHKHGQKKRNSSWPRELFAYEDDF